MSALLAATVMFSAGAGNAAVTIYTTVASFNAAVRSPAIDTFEDFAIVAPTPSPVVRLIGSYGYTATVSVTDPLLSDTFYGAGSNADRWLSTNFALGTIVFSAFTGGVKGVGGFFFGSDMAGAFQSGNVNVTAADGSGSVGQLLTGATTTTFLGFVTTGTFTSIKVGAVQPVGDFMWPTVNDLRLAAGPVPEPATWALMIVGFGLIGAALRHRATAVA